jgi:CheY-like chemotaxis protein
MSVASPARVLIVEDDAFAAEIMQETLVRSGVACMARRAATAEALERSLDDAAPDLVLSDCNVAGVDGGALLACLRGRWPAVPVVMVSGAFRTGEPEALLAGGAAACIAKDRLWELVAFARRILTGPRPGQPSNPAPGVEQA